MALARATDPYSDPSWSGWGDPANVPELPEEVLSLLGHALGVSRPGRRPGPISAVTLPASRLPAPVRTMLETAIGVANVVDRDEARVRHTRGKSTPDLLRVRAGDFGAAPDLVVLPGSHQQVLEALRICSQHRIAVVPFGGGTSVVGGLQPRSEPFAGVIALDPRRLNGLLGLDEVSRVATLEVGLRGPQAESLLGSRGFTTGHYPQSFEYATIGGYAATRSSGQASAGYGRFDDLVVGLRVATPVGELSIGGRAPKSAAGPDLRQLILGSEGTLGVITAVSLQIRPLPETRVYEGWRFDSFADARGPGPRPGARSGRELGAGPLSRAVSPGRTARRRSTGRDAGDGHLLVLASGPLRRGVGGAPRLAHRAGHPAGDPMPHLPRVSVGGVA
ncbi:MAG TPA: FAD-binding oxidoreductase, partial [Solirubrobacteraceae bacterium]